MLYTVSTTNHTGIEGTVTSSSGREFLTSHPLNDQPGTNPEELLSAAWATCLNATIQALLDARGYQGTASRVSVTTNLMKAEVGYYFEVSAKASVDLKDDSLVASLVESAHKRCPVSQLIGQNAHVHLAIEAYQA